MKLVFTIIFLSSLFGQDLEKKDTLRYIFEPDSLFLRVGETEEVTIKMVNSDGSMAGAPFLIYGQPRRSLEASPRISDSTGYAKVKVKPYKSGSLKLQVRSISIKREDRIYGAVKVTVPKPKLKRIVFKDSVNKHYEGTQVKLNPIVYDEANLVRKEVAVSLKSSNPKVASIDGIGNLVILKPGKTTLSASVDSLSTSFKLTAIKNPARSLSISADKDMIRTGDVLSFEASVFDRGNKILEDAPIQFFIPRKSRIWHWFAAFRPNYI